MDLEALQDEAKVLSTRKQELSREQGRLTDALEAAETQNKELSVQATVSTQFAVLFAQK